MYDKRIKITITYKRNLLSTTNFMSLPVETKHGVFSVQRKTLIFRLSNGLPPDLKEPLPSPSSVLSYGQYLLPFTSMDVHLL